MEYLEMRIFLENNTSLKLIRKKNFALIFSFLYQEFILNNLNSIRKERLVGKLSSYLDEINYKEDDEELNLLFETRAKSYIESWANEGYLWKGNINGEEFCELTYDSQQIFEWVLEQNKIKDSMSTGFKIKEIFEKINNIIIESETDKEKVLENLLKEKEELEKKVKRIKKSNSKIQSLDSRQIKEKYLNANRLAQELITDFKKVENNFVKIKNKIIEKEVENDYSKGDLVEIFLDEYSNLESSDEAKSFNEFFDFLNSKRRTNEFDDLFEKLITLLEKNNINYESSFLSNFKKPLISSAERVNKRKRQLNSRLAQIIQQGNLKERKDFLNIIREIKKYSIKNKEILNKSNINLEIEFTANIDLPLDKRLTHENSEPIYSEDIIEVSKPDSNGSKMKSFYNKDFVNSKIIRKNIKSFLKINEKTTLGQILEDYPISKGINELLVYFATCREKGFKTTILENQFEEIQIDKKTKFKIEKIIIENGN